MPVTHPTPSNHHGRILAAMATRGGLYTSTVAELLQGPMPPLTGPEFRAERQRRRQRRVPPHTLSDGSRVQPGRDYRRASRILSELRAWGYVTEAGLCELAHPDYPQDVDPETCRGRMVAALRRGPVVRADLLWLGGGNHGPRVDGWEPDGHLKRVFRSMVRRGEVDDRARLTEAGAALVGGWREAA